MLHKTIFDFQTWNLCSKYSVRHFVVLFVCRLFPSLGVSGLSPVLRCQFRDMSVLPFDDQSSDDVSYLVWPEDEPFRRSEGTESLIPMTKIMFMEHITHLYDLPLTIEDGYFPLELKVVVVGAGSAWHKLVGSGRGWIILLFFSKWPKSVKVKKTVSAPRAWRCCKSFVCKLLVSCNEALFRT